VAGAVLAFIGGLVLWTFLARAAIRRCNRER
jgi:hypothetical protein